VIYQRVGRTRQARLHAQIGQALEDLCRGEPGERVSELARHFLGGRPGDALKAARYARLAGERALAALAPHEAAGWFSQAIEALQPVPDDAERARCAVALGDAEIQAGIPTGRQTLLDAARTASQLGESDLLIRAALASNRGMFARTGHVDAELVALLDDALEVCPGSPQRARLLSRLAAELTFHHDPAWRRAIADEAVAAAHVSGDPGALLDALTRPDTALMIPELSDLRLSRLQQARTLADRINDPAAKFWAAYQLALALFERADPDGVDQALGHAEEMARKLGQALMQFFVTAARCSQAMLNGQLDAADRLAGEALQIVAANGQPDAAELYGGQLFYIRWHRGRLQEVLAPLNRFAAELPEFLAASASLALAEAIDGRPERAGRLLHTATDVGFAHRTASWLLTHCSWAEVAVELNEHNVPGVLYDRLLPWRRLFAASGPSPCTPSRTRSGGSPHSTDGFRKSTSPTHSRCISGCEPRSASRPHNSPGAAYSSPTTPTAPADSSPTPPRSPPDTGTATFGVQHTTRRRRSSRRARPGGQTRSRQRGPRPCVTSAWNMATTADLAYSQSTLGSGESLRELSPGDYAAALQRVRDQLGDQPPQVDGS
jgi:hypothetical protein